MRKIVVLGALGFALALAGCDDSSNTSSSQAYQGSAAPLAPEMMLATDMVPQRGRALKAQSSAPRMEIGRSYRIEITQGQVEAAMQADHKACLKFGCVVTSVSSSLVSDRPMASLRALVPKDNAGAFHEYVMAAPDRVIASFQQTATNREEQYQDIKSRLERLEFMRKRLFSLADKKSDKVGELLQVERELMRVETDIERLTRNRKGVEKVTDNVAFNLNYRARPPKAGDIDFSPFTRLLSDMANTVIGATRTTLLWLARWMPVAFLVWGLFYIVRRRFGDDDTE
ncbi:MAG: DUF4349 domain-containing protein [Magnetovibrio sp.]|nr:DUF4349 domain-containing protein [Magnetovibrio sp.]